MNREKISQYSPTKLLFILCLVQFTLSADVANLSIATSSLIVAFDTNIEQIKIAGTIYPLIGAAFMLMGGMAGLFLGWRVLLISGASLGFTSSICAIVAPNIEFLTYVARMMSGLSAALMLPAALALVVAHFNAEKRAVALGAMAACTGVAAAIIPAFNGWIIDTISWKSGFSVITFLYAITALGALLWIAPLPINRPKKFDFIGCILGSTGLILLVFGLLKIPNWGFLLSANPDLSILPEWLSLLSPAFVLICFGLVVLCAFISHEKRFEEKYHTALLPCSWLTNITMLKSLGILMVMYIIIGGVNFTLITFLQVGASLSATHSGVIVLTFAVSMILFSIVTPLIFKSFSARLLCVIAFIILILSSFILHISCTEEGVHQLIYFAMLLLGMGLGILASQAPILIINSVGEQGAAQSGGIQATVRNIGVALGIAIMAGSGQFMMESHLRTEIESNTEITTLFKQQVKDTPYLPYVDDEMLQNILHRIELDKELHPLVTNINARARSISFDTSSLLMGLIAALGLLVALRLPKHDGNNL